MNEDQLGLVALSQLLLWNEKKSMKKFYTAGEFGLDKTISLCFNEINDLDSIFYYMEIFSTVGQRIPWRAIFLSISAFNLFLNMEL